LDHRYGFDGLLSTAVVKDALTTSLYYQPTYQCLSFLNGIHCVFVLTAYISLTKYKQMGKEFLGEFEELVLTMVAALQEDAYGAAITDEIESRLNRDVNLSAVHVTLYRLEDKGFLKSKLGGETKERGGRRKRIYTVTNSGMATLKAMKEARTDLWKLIPQLKFV
jgi:DNA-binding PadR family transcriptional regulator